MPDTTPDPGPRTAVLPRVDPDGVTPPPTPGDTGAAPASVPAQSAADATDAPPPTEPRPGPRPPVPGLPAHVRGPVRGSTVTGWMVDASRVCGEWLALSTSAATRSVVLIVTDEAAFMKWCGHLNIAKNRRPRRTDELGTYIQGTTTAHGWTITVHLPNPLPTQETRR